MNLSEQLGMIEAENSRLKLELEASKASNQRQAGALKESRAQNNQLIKRNEWLAARVAYLEKHFHDFHGSAAEIERQRKEQAEHAATAPEVVSDQQPERLMDKITRLGRVMKGSEAATNGASNGATVQ